MSSRIEYEICPACGCANPEKKPACPACDNRLFSDGEDEHRRYVALIESEHRKRTWFWFGGWTLIAMVTITPMLLLLAGRLSRAPSVGTLLAALFGGWRLLDLKKKREGSARFLSRYKNA
jgi:hypothetical protein